MCDKKNKVLFTDSECLVLSPDFKLPDENQVLLRVPRQNNMYSFNLENIVPTRGLACLIAKAIVDESNKWHRRLGHVHGRNERRIFDNFFKGPAMIDLDSDDDLVKVTLSRIPRRIKEVQMRDEKEKMLKYEEDKKKRRHELMNSDHWKLSVSKIRMGKELKDLVHFQLIIGETPLLWLKRIDP
ncbi:hypothetical protein Tco_0572696 [Tanacetum coccineum]